MSTGVPLSHRTACRAVKPPTALAQLPEIPTTWPLSLIAVAALAVSLARGRSGCTPGLRPADRLPAVVQPGREAVRAAERRQRRHLAVLPYEAAAYMTARAAREEGRAAPGLASWIGVRGLGDPDHDSPVVLHRPQHRAVGPAQRSEVGERTVAPEGGVPDCVAWPVRRPRDPATVVNADPGATRATERPQLGDDVLGRGVMRRGPVLGMR